MGRMGPRSSAILQWSSANSCWEQYSKDKEHRDGTCLACQKILCWVSWEFCGGETNNLHYRRVTLLWQILIKLILKIEQDNRLVRPSKYDSKKGSCDVANYWCLFCCWLESLLFNLAESWFLHDHCDLKTRICMWIYFRLSLIFFLLLVTLCL